MAGELDANLLKNLDERLKSMNETLGRLQKSIEGVGSAMSIAFGSAAQKMVSDMQQAFRGAQLIDMLGVDQARLNIDKLEKDIIRLRGNLRTHTEGEVVLNAKSGNWKYNRGEKNSLKDEKATRDALNDAIQKLNYSRMTESQLAMKFGQISAKMAEEEEKRLLNLIKLRNQYKESIASLMADTRVSMKRNNGEMTPFDQKNIELARERAKVVVEIENELTRVAQQTEEQRKSALIKGNTQLENEELRHQEKMNAIRRQEYKGIAGQQSINPVWNNMMARANEREQSIAKATEGYIKKQQKLDELYAKLDQQNAKLQSQRENGVSENSQKKTQNEIAKTESAIKRAENAQQAFIATLLSTDKGRVALAALRNEFGLVEEEEKKVSSVFDRIISDINAKAQKGGEELSKKLTDANAIRSEAQRSFEAIKQEYDKAIGGINPIGATALANMGKVDPQMLSSAARKRYLKQQQEEAARLSGGQSLVSPELIRRQELAQQTLNAAMQRYNDLLQQVNAQQEKYAARVEAIQGVSEKYQKISDQIQALRDRFAELYVKKEAKLIDDEKFKAQSDAIIKRYEELVRERDKFEKGQDIDMAVRSKMEEEQRLAQIRKDNAKSRVQDEKNAERLILQEQRKRAAEEKASAREKINAAKKANQQEYKTIQEQIRLNRQITDLWRNYRQLQSNTPKNKWGYTTELVDAKNNSANCLHSLRNLRRLHRAPVNLHLSILNMTR
jgi:hypothetical protein